MKNDNNEVQCTPALIPIFICIMCIVTICFCGLTFLEKGKVTKIEINNTSIQDSIIYNIEETNTENQYIEIRGWALKQNENIDMFYTHIVLVNENTNTYLQIPTVMENREDVNKVYSDNFDYTASGFYSKVKKSKLSSGTYTIGIYYQNNQNDILTLTSSTITI